MKLELHMVHSNRAKYDKILWYLLAVGGGSTGFTVVVGVVLGSAVMALPIIILNVNDLPPILYMIIDYTYNYYVYSPYNSYISWRRRRRSHNEQGWLIVFENNILFTFY